MQCLSCGGAFEWAPGNQHARCVRCLSIFTYQNGQLTPVVVEAPGGGYNPEFNAIFAQNLGFGPPPPGAMPMPPPQQQHNLGAGTFDMGGGQQLRVKINGKSPENYMKDRASSMIWGWIIGAVILGLIVITFIGIGIYVYIAAKDTDSGPTRSATAKTWDGRTPFVCGGNDVVALVGVTATSGVEASGNCKLTLTGVNITAPVGIDASANAKVTMTGGSITASTSSVIASANAKVDLVGTRVVGKSRASGNAKVTGAL